MMLAERIKERRVSLKLSQSDLARLTGFSQMQISRYEAGINDPTTKALVALAHALQTSPDWLLGFVDKVDASVLNEQEKEMLLLFRAKAPERRSNLIEIIRVAN